jgi:lysophospholipase L1-like esterase
VPRTVFIAGDSTAQPGGPGAIGWGKLFADLFFDPAKIEIVNAARGGRSSRTFVTEGHWERLLEDVKPRDYVLIQVGHNDGGPVNHRIVARGSLPGLGDETQEIDNEQTGQHETVHTFGWYMKKMIRETKAEGAMPILLSLTVRNIWTDGRVERGSGQYSQWTRELAESEGIAFIDLTNMVADAYEAIGPKAVGAFFPRDHTHTSAAGAALSAQCVLSGIKALHENGILRGLSVTGRLVEVGPPEAIMAAQLPVPRGATQDVFLHWLNLPEIADPALPTVFLIGDSTVRNGRGDGVDGQWGWGDALSVYFDPAKVNLVNRAVGGLGARTFISSGYWDPILKWLKPGDFVVMQFGHNDNGSRGALRGTGDQTEDRQDRNGRAETVHTFGWYLRKYVAETRARGATPIICTLVPRNSWDADKISRPTDSHADWAREVAEAENVPLFDLYEGIAARYDALGREAVAPLFADERVHTSRPGAELAAEVVIRAMRGLPGDPLAKYLRAEPAVHW